MSKRAIGLVPARGGSQGIPRKNLVPLCGRPLIAWTLEAAQRSGLERVVVSTDDPEIARVCREAGAEVPFTRPAGLARDDTPGIDVVLHALRWIEDHEGSLAEVVMLLQPTSPLRRTEHIDAALALFEQRGADSLVSVVAAPHNMIPESLMRMTDAGRLAPCRPMDERRNLRQLKPSYYARNGAAIYLAATRLVLERQTLYGDRLVGYEMTREDSIDVDEPFDLELCEWLLSKRRAGTGAGS